MGAGGGFPWSAVTYNACSHAMQPVVIGGLTLYATRRMSLSAKVPMPDFGCYLDTMWEKDVSDGRIVGSSIHEFKVEHLYPAVIINWPDHGVIELPLLTHLVEWIRETARAGKKIEVACVGGHGRTGTLLAAVAIAELGLNSADEAIALIRSAYCKEAVESIQQENLLRLLTGEPEKKEVPTTTTYKGLPTVNWNSGHGWACGCEHCIVARKHPYKCQCEHCAVTFPYQITDSGWED